MRLQLVTLAQRLKLVTNKLDNKASTLDPAVKAAGEARRRSEMCKKVLAGLANEHQCMLQRAEGIEKRKETFERNQALRNRALKQINEAKKAVQKEKEKHLTIVRKLQRLQNAARVAEERARLAKAKAKLAAIGRDDVEDITLEAAEEAERQEQAKALEEARKHAARLRESSRRLDYLTRAVRQEEAPKLQQRFKSMQKIDEEYYKKQMAKLAAEHRAKWEISVAQKKRCSKMDPYRVQFEAILMDKRGNELKLQLARDMEQKRVSIPTSSVLIFCVCTAYFHVL